MRVLLVLTTFLVSATAQDQARTQPDKTKEVRHRLGLVATRAIANFRSADSIEERLRAEGMSLHPDLVGLRLNIESELDRADAAIEHNDLSGAAKALDRAQAHLDRFAARLGGN